MKKAIFITVRTDSSRLENKALLKILGKTTIELVVLRAKLVKNADQVVLCTTDRPIDDDLVNIAQRCGISSFRGSTEDKLDRWLGATKKFRIDILATMDGDDLLCDPELMDLGLAQIESHGSDFIRAPEGLICGSFTYCIRSSALEKVCQIKGTTDTEMMWTYFEDTGLFKVEDLNVRDRIFFSENLRMTLDYIEDFEFFSKIFEHFNSLKNDVPLRKIVAFLNKNPDIPKINWSRHVDWAANQKRKTKIILKEMPRS